MTPEQFTYWLQGFMETANPETINKEQTQIIKDHLKLVFEKKTPDYNQVIKMPTGSPYEFPFNPPYPDTTIIC